MLYVCTSPHIAFLGWGEGEIVFDIVAGVSVLAISVILALGVKGIHEMYFVY